MVIRRKRKNISERELCFFLAFSSTYLREHGFSMVAYLEHYAKNRPDVGAVPSALHVLVFHILRETCKRLYRFRG